MYEYQGERLTDPPKAGYCLLLQVMENAGSRRRGDSRLYYRPEQENLHSSEAMRPIHQPEVQATLGTAAVPMEDPSV